MIIKYRESSIINFIKKKTINLIKNKKIINLIMIKNRNKRQKTIILKIQIIKMNRN